MCQILCTFKTKLVVYIFYSKRKCSEAKVLDYLVSFNFLKLLKFVLSCLQPFTLHLLCPIVSIFCLGNRSYFTPQCSLTRKFYLYDVKICFRRQELYGFSSSLFYFLVIIVLDFFFILSKEV